MTTKLLKRKATALTLGLASLALVATPSSAVELAAVESQATMPDGAVITMWSFVDAGNSAAGFACPAAPVAWSAPLTIDATAGTALTVNIKNCLGAPVSVFIPGQTKATTPVWTDGSTGSRGGDLGKRVRSFDAETAPGAVGSYTWPNVKDGTYLVHSGTHPQVQVQMGLYATLAVDSELGPGCAYSRDGLNCDLAYDQSGVFLFSEIDPALHTAVQSGAYGTAAYPSTFDYHPKYFLINGEAYSAATLPYLVATSADVLLRMVNAGLMSHSPTFGGGLFAELYAEDGNLYPFSMQQYGIELPPGKTLDATLNIGSDGTYPMYDRALHLVNGAQSGGGMLAYLEAAAAANAPTVVDDSYSVAEEGSLAASAGDLSFPGVLDNDGTGADRAIVVSDVSAGVLALSEDGSFTYAPDTNFTGTDHFSYVANDGLGGADSNVATVSITVTPVNDQPVASADAFDATEGRTLSVPAPGVLANDSDVDGDGLSAALYGAAPAGSLLLNADGSFDYTPAGAAGAIESFQYVANDGVVSSAPATVTITVVTAVNAAPVATDDYASTLRNTPKVISIVANDSDPDGSIDGASVIITSGSVTAAGGEVVNHLDGTVTFSPKRGFRGTDSFTYTVADDQGAVSNQATVRVNVTK